MQLLKIISLFFVFKYIPFWNTRLADVFCLVLQYYCNITFIFLQKEQVLGKEYDEGDEMEEEEDKEEKDWEIGKSRKIGGIRVEEQGT